jgi:nucleotide-binding universal stress UspA family protein
MSVPASKPKAILVPVDGSENSERAIGAAKRIALLLGVDVGVCEVNRDGEAGLERSGEYLQKLIRNWNLKWSEVGTYTDVAAGVCEIADRHEALVVMATGGHGRVNALFGSTATEVMKRTDKTVVLIGRSVDVNVNLPFNRIVVALDGSPMGSALCGRAASWAQWFDVRLQLVTVVEPIPPPLREWGETAHWFGNHGDASAYLATMVERLGAIGVGVSGVVCADPISPASGLGEMLREKPGAVLVVATHARTGWQLLVRGSVAGDIVDESSVPVLALASEH